MKVRFTGPQNYVDVFGYGRHPKDEVKEYPGIAAEELFEDSHGRFEEVGGDESAKIYAGGNAKKRTGKAGSGKK